MENLYVSKGKKSTHTHFAAVQNEIYSSFKQMLYIYRFFGEIFAFPLVPNILRDRSLQFQFLSNFFVVAKGDTPGTKFQTQDTKEAGRKCEDFPFGIHFLIDVPRIKWYSIWKKKKQTAATTLICVSFISFLSWARPIGMSKLHIYFFFSDWFCTIEVFCLIFFCFGTISFHMLYI